MARHKKNTKRVSRNRPSSVGGPTGGVKKNTSKVITIAVLLTALAIGICVFALFRNMLETVDIRIGDSLVKVEIADTPQSREKGLSGREHLKADHGMLFVFDYLRKQGFWMKDTHIPLSIAFISADGKILQIEQMEPLDLHPVASHSPIRYALEVNKGFFQENGITVGMRVDLSNVVDR